MGAQHGRQQSCRNTKLLLEAAARAESRLGKAAVSCRYHRAPKRLQDDYEPILGAAELGSGASGSVQRWQRRGSGMQVAVKSFKLRGCWRAVSTEAAANEAELLLSLDHPGVVRLLDVYESADELHLVMHCLEGGELMEEVERRRGLNEIEAADLAVQMLQALGHVHGHGLVHRDVKLSNWVFADAARTQLRLLDFGLSGLEGAPADRACGTVAYMSPEALEGDCSQKGDMWALGICLFSMLTAAAPFRGESEEEQAAAIRSGLLNTEATLWPGLDELTQDFILRLLEVLPSKRLSVDEALRHPWISHRPSLEWAPASSLDGAAISALRSYPGVFHLRRAALHAAACSLQPSEWATIDALTLELGSSPGSFVSALRKQGVDEEESRVIFEALTSGRQLQCSDVAAVYLAAGLLTDLHVEETFRRLDETSTGRLGRAQLLDRLGHGDLEESAEAKDDGLALADFRRLLLGTEEPSSDAETETDEGSGHEDSLSSGAEDDEGWYHASFSAGSPCIAGLAERHDQPGPLSWRLCTKL